MSLSLLQGLPPAILASLDTKLRFALGFHALQVLLQFLLSNFIFSFAFNPPKAISLWAYPSFVLEQAFLVADIFSSLLTPSSDVVVGSSSLALETAFLVDAMFEPCNVSFVFLAF